MAWITCFVVTIVVSAVTTPRAASELRGLTYALTPRVAEAARPWHQRPEVLAVIVLVLVIALNIIFR